MKYLLIIALLVILFVIFSLKFKNKSESFISIDKLQIRTGRNYSDCIIKKNMNKISIINNYLKNNPQRIPNGLILLKLILEINIEDGNTIYGPIKRYKN